MGGGDALRDLGGSVEEAVWHTLCLSTMPQQSGEQKGGRRHDRRQELASAR
jgi:hypothetical protein